jgi:putative transposase
MPEYFEFIATPALVDTLSKFIQSLGRKYVGYYNKKYNRKGTIWEGRYKASLVEADKYLFGIMCSIESRKPDSTFSSLAKNLYGVDDTIVSQHSLYKELGSTNTKRVEEYAKIFNTKLDEDVEKFINQCLEKQLVTGTPSYVKMLEKSVGMILSSKKRGRPKKEITNQRKKMYKNLVVLDKEKHDKLKLNPVENLFFAKDSFAIPTLVNEMEVMSRAFPVVFSGAEIPAVISLVSLGGDCLAINSDGKWITAHVPLYLRKYPFSLASTKEKLDQKVVLVDEGSSLISKSKGKQLFKKSGEKADVLVNAIEYLKSYEEQSEVMRIFAKTIADSGILEDREISVGEGDEKKVLIKGFKVVDKEKLNALSDDILADWVRRGIINLIDIHMKSLNHIQTLFDLAQKRQN